MKEKFVFFIAKLLGVDIKIKEKLHGVKFGDKSGFSNAFTEDKCLHENVRKCTQPQKWSTEGLPDDVVNKWKL